MIDDVLIAFMREQLAITSLDFVRSTYSEIDWSLRLDIMLHAYMFTLSGIPVLYSGDEIAQRNDYSYHDNPVKAPDSRFLHRGAMDWEAAEKRHDPESVEGKIFSAITGLERPSSRASSRRKRTGI